MGGNGSGRRPNEESRDAVRFFLETYSNGATLRELATFTGLPFTLVQSQLHSMLAKDQVHKTHPDLRTAVWHLTDQPKLTPRANPGRIPSRATPRTR